jgi:hypothetical protein
MQGSRLCDGEHLSFPVFVFCVPLLVIAMNRYIKQKVVLLTSSFVDFGVLFDSAVAISSLSTIGGCVKNAAKDFTCAFFQRRPQLHS